jgi:hypothetical protein
MTDKHRPNEKHGRRDQDNVGHADSDKLYNALGLRVSLIKEITTERSQ